VKIIRSTWFSSRSTFSRGLPFMEIFYRSDLGVSKGICGVDIVCVPLEATAETMESHVDFHQWSHHVHSCNLRCTKFCCTFRTSKLCRSIPGKIFNFLPDNDAKNVSTRSHPLIVSEVSMIPISLYVMFK